MVIFLDVSNLSQDLPVSDRCLQPTMWAATHLVLRQGDFFAEELQTMADPQYILTLPPLLLRAVGGGPLPHGMLDQLHRCTDRWHLQTSGVLQDKKRKQRHRPLYLWIIAKQETVKTCFCLSKPGLKDVKKAKEEENYTVKVFNLLETLLLDHTR